MIDFRSSVYGEYNPLGGGDKAACVHHFVEKQAELTPERNAIEFGSDEVSYKELVRRADLFAEQLRCCGVRLNSRVAIYASRSVNQLIAVLGILKAGCAYVPLDPRYPRDRLSMMLEDSKAEVLVTETGLQDLIPSVMQETICLDRFDWGAKAEAKEFPQGEWSDEESLAYVIYTSGSTGKPKGVAMPHRPLLHLIAWQNSQSIQLPPNARTIQFTSLSFDVSFQEIFSTWSSGGTLVLMEEELRYDSRALWEYLREQEIHRLFLPFVALQQLADAAAECDVVPGSLQEVITAGEQLRITPKIRAMFHRLPGSRLQNHYGPAETHVVTCYTLPADVNAWTDLPPIGRSLPNAELHLLDEQGDAVSQGEPGELYIGGGCLARGYLDQPELTAARFLPDSFSSTEGARMYRTGDLARMLPDGNLEFLGRKDDQIKIRGFRVELGEIEAVLSEHPSVRECAVALEGSGEQRMLIACIVPVGEQRLVEEDLREFLKARLADYMVPTVFASIERLPLTPSGKVDRKALPQISKAILRKPETSAQPQTEVQQGIKAIWKEILQVTEVGVHDNFFDLGGNSLMLAKVRGRLKEKFRRKVTFVTLFQYPTISSLAEYLAEPECKTREGHAQSRCKDLESSQAKPASFTERKGLFEPIAIVGMAGRFPGAKSFHEFWNNLCEAKDCVRRFTDDELRQGGTSEECLNDPSYVRARGVLEGADLFDAAFFGFTGREAELTDPQQRLFLECSWEALEDAACNPNRFAGSIGVYAGSSFNTYFLSQVMRDRMGLEDFTRAFQVDDYNVLVGADKDYLASRVAYKLNLRGPAMTVQTACSTSLVAVCQACAALQGGECDAALAGGVSISFPQERGYFYQEGAIASSDGRCRAFDANATGTVFGAGAGVVLLKRLTEAVANGDHIYAVIKGAAVNNDGSDKVSFSAPSVNGQVSVIREAQKKAAVPSDSIGFIEAHGTGTPLGDPIEIAALTQAFRDTTNRRQFCALGSVKSNIGHLEAAAGVTGLIKATLALKNQLIPPTLHYETPNPKCDFADSPFFINREPLSWKKNGMPRRAGVSSFGVGGTNAHVVLEEAPARASEDMSKGGWKDHLLVFSAKTESALDSMTQNLAAHLEKNDHLNLSDVAFSLQTGRKEFSFRRALVASSREEAIQRLKTLYGKKVYSGKSGTDRPSVVFLFPGQGVQYAGMGRELYRSQPVFRKCVDRCCDYLTPLLGLDLRIVIDPSSEQVTEFSGKLKETRLAQPALFVIEYALAELWMSWGVQPAALAGHSLGEFTAAVVAGVMSLEDGLSLVTDRARMMQSQPEGSMLSVRLSEEELRLRLEGQVSIAAVNGPKLCVASGPQEEIDRLQRRLQGEGVVCKKLSTSHAFHSSMMDPILEEFRERVSKTTLHPSRIPILSSKTGQWIQSADWTDPSYWGNQLRQPVRFADVLERLSGDYASALLEVGPGQTLTTLALQRINRSGGSLALACMPPAGNAGEIPAILMALGRLWVGGGSVDWNALWQSVRPERVPLPVYPFERRRYWVERTSSKCEQNTGKPEAEKASKPEQELASAGGSGDSANDQESCSPGLVEETVLGQLAAMNAQLETLKEVMKRESPSPS